MKNALFKDAFREIRKSFGRFMAIFVIIAIGSGFFAGIKATMPDMINTAEIYFKEKALMDIKLVSTIGVRSEDVEAVKQADNVSGVMAGYSKDVYYKYESRNLVLKFMSYNSELDENSQHKLNRPELLEGRYPEREGECLIEVKATSPHTFKVGSTIKVSEPDDTKKLSDFLTNDTYKIVGVCSSPLYIGYERDSTDVGSGEVTSNVYVPEYDFVEGYYTELYVKFDGTENYDPFSDEYKKRVKELRKEAEEKFTDSVSKRYEKLASDAKSRLEKAKDDINALEQILDMDKSALRKQKSVIETQLKQAQIEYEKSREGTLSRLLTESAVVKAQNALKIAEELLRDKDENGEYHQKYKDQLEAAKAETEQGESELESSAEPKIYSFDRFEASDDYSSFYEDSKKIDSISKVFPVFFILVAGLVCLTTMTRMVEEQRTLIGTYKALGISEGRIIGKYLMYAAAASVLGSCLGTAAGSKIIPKIIYGGYKIMYNIPNFQTSVKLWYMVGCCAVSVLCTCAACAYACIDELREQPSQLMRPKPPKSGKRIWLEKYPKIWGKLNFLGKVTVRNLLRYKKRFFLSVIGTAGCTALIVTGFGLKNSIKTIADKQFNEVFVYKGMIMLNSDNYSYEQLKKKIEETDGVEQFMMMRSQTADVSAGGEKQSVSVIVANEPENMENYVHFRDVKTGGKIELKDGEVIITEKLAKLLKLSSGESFMLKDSNSEEVDLKISAVSKNYALHYVYMTPKTYEDKFGEKAVYNLAFVNLTDGDDEKFKSELIKQDEFYGMAYKEDSSKGFLNSVDSLDSVVILLIVCAGGLAVVVLYNLANINITERIREVATVKVLGFYENETSEYICRENYISSALGILIGFGLGKILHYFVVITSEVDIVMFNRQLVWWAYLFGGLLTFGCNVIVNLILRLVIGKVDMVESLKSVE